MRKARVVKIAERYIENNWKSVRSRADSILGDGNYNPEELRSIALLSFRKFYLGKMKSSSKADLTTAFLFHLGKELRDQMESIAYCEGGKRHVYTEESDDSDISTIEASVAVWADEGDSVWGVSEYIEPGFEEEVIPGNGGPHFSISIDSFENKNVSTTLLESLAMLTNVENCLKSVGCIIGARQPKQISNRLRSMLFNELTKKGAKIYRGECLNGRRGNVIVCASSEKEAKKYFELYGRLLRCKELDISSLS